jgi:hypothetical protein
MYPLELKGLRRERREGLAVVTSGDVGRRVQPMLEREERKADSVEADMVLKGREQGLGDVAFGF